MRSEINTGMEMDSNLLGFQLFRSLSEFEFNRLNSDSSCELFKKGTVVYKEGSRLSGCFCIVMGIVKIFKTGNDGKEQIIRFAQKGEIIGYRSLISQELACSTTEVIDEAVLYHIPYKTVLFLIESNWKFSLQLIHVLCRELRESNDYLTGLAQKSIRERLAEVLLLLKENFELDNQNILQISLKRMDLADAVGTAPESLIRVLSEFKNEKIVELKGRKIKFLDIPILRRMANM